MFRTPLLRVARVPGPPRFGQKGGQIVYRRAVDLVVEPVQVVLGRRVSWETAGESLVEGRLCLLIGGNLASLLPPLLEISPPNAVHPDWPIVDQDVFGATDDFDRIGDHVGYTNVRLVQRGEDDVFRLAVRTMERNHIEHGIATLRSRLAQLGTYEA